MHDLRYRCVVVVYSDINSPLDDTLVIALGSLQSLRKASLYIHIIPAQHSYHTCGCQNSSVKVIHSESFMEVQNQHVT